MLLVSGFTGASDHNAPLFGRLAGLGQLFWADRDGIAGKHG